MPAVVDGLARLRSGGRVVVRLALTTSCRATLAALAIALGCSRTPAPPATQGTAASGDQKPSTTKAADLDGQAPAAQLTRTSGEKVALGELLHQHAQTVVVFYRGFW